MKFTILATLLSSAAAFAPVSQGGKCRTFYQLVPSHYPKETGSYRFLISLLCLCWCFFFFLHSTSSASASKAVTALNAEKSPAMPFLPYPKNLKGYIGEETGFDPLGISDIFPMDYMREAEIKHCRLAMLAWLGFVITDLGFIVHPLGKGLTSVQAHDVLCDQKVMGNALIFVCLAEMVSYIGVSEMLQGSGREPGNFGFGHFYYKGKTTEQINKLKYQEIKVRVRGVPFRERHGSIHVPLLKHQLTIRLLFQNGRLAMLAFSGVVTQSVLYGKGFPYF